MTTADFRVDVIVSGPLFGGSNVPAATLFGNAAAPVNSGKTGNGLIAQLPKALVSCVTLEFGTYAGARVLTAIAADGWLHTFGDLNSPKGRAIKAEIRAAFYPDQDDWKDLVAARSAEVLAQALAGLASG